MRVKQFIKQFNWRFLLVRIVVNAIALAVTAFIVPRIYFVDTSVRNWLLMAFMLGVLNGLIKPVLQFLTFQLIFVSYGLVIVVVNALILMLLSALFPDRFAVDSLLWALVGGLVLGILSSFLESLLGLTVPVVPDEMPELRRQVEEEVRHRGWLTAARTEFGSGEQVPDPDALPPAGERGQTAEAQGLPPVPAEATTPAGTDVPEATTPAPEGEAPSGDAVTSGEGDSPPPKEAVAEPPDAVAAPEPAPEPQEEAEEDPS